MKKHLLLTTLTLALCALANPAQGHGLGQSLEKQVGDYAIDIGYDSFVPEIPAGEAVRFDFILWNKNKTEPLDFTTAWVRIAPQNGQGPLFAGALGVPDFGPTGMSYVFPSGGSYELTVRFQNKDQTLAETSFPLTVEGSSEKNAGAQSIRTALMGGFVGLVSGIAIVWFFKKRI